MNKTTRIIIAVAVVAAAALAFVAKQSKRTPPVAATESAIVATGPSIDSNTTVPATATARLPRLVDLGASKCIPCKMMKPILDDLMANFADRFSTEFIDVWENREAGKQYGIEMIPTQIFYDAEGKELFRHVGFYSKEDIFAKWKELGVTLAENDRSENKSSSERTEREQ